MSEERTKREDHTHGLWQKIILTYRERKRNYKPTWKHVGRVLWNISGVRETWMEVPWSGKCASGMMNGAENKPNVTKTRGETQMLIYDHNVVVLTFWFLQFGRLRTTLDGTNCCSTHPLSTSPICHLLLWYIFSKYLQRPLLSSVSCINLKIWLIN